MPMPMPLLTKPVVKRIHIRIRSQQSQKTKLNKTTKLENNKKAEANTHHDVMSIVLNFTVRLRPYDITKCTKGYRLASFL